MFNEDNTIEQMSVEALASLGWRYVAAEDLPRRHADVMVEPMVKDALIRLNPEIAEDPDRADEIIYRLRALIQSTSPQNLVSTNERFKKLVIEENSFPYGKDGRMVPIRFFGTAADGDLDKTSTSSPTSGSTPRNRAASASTSSFLSMDFRSSSASSRRRCAIR